MRLLNCHVENFGSYKSLDFDFTNLGLTLIQGPTGSGKSTICDIPCWILFGVTAKNGSVDEVKSWKANNVTKGVLNVQLSSGSIEVTRLRGKGSQNDLYWVEHGKKIRGKDITETQTLLEGILGVDASLYLAASYFSEFSKVGSFFTATAKDRQATLEQLTDLTFPAALRTKLDASKRVTRVVTRTKLDRSQYVRGSVNQRRSSISLLQENEKEWQKTLEGRIQGLKAKEASFEQSKEKQISHLERRISDLSYELSPVKPQDKLCPTCGSVNKEAQAAMLRSTFHESNLVALKNELSKVYTSVNVYGEQLQELLQAPNPYTSQLSQHRAALIVEEQEQATLTSELTALQCRSEALDQLIEAASQLRGELLQKSIKEIEVITNDNLEKYFDAEIRVGFTLDVDKLNVEIHKNGYECTYRQLSKGQRQLLKLCFVTGVMHVAANESGVHFQNLYLDESLDGLDTELKLKAFGLLESLAVNRESVIVVDHSPEFHSKFSKRYEVAMIDDESVIEESYV